MNAIMAKLIKAMVAGVVNTTRNAMNSSNFTSPTEAAFVRSARAKSLNQIS